MTSEELRTAICQYFNQSEGFGAQFIQSPTTARAPVGTYIAVKVDSVRQDGSAMMPNHGDEGARFVNVASVVFIEVEGDGELIRKVRNEIQLPAFLGYCENKGFSIWDIGQILEAPSYDGKFYVRQWRMSVQINFVDVVSLEKEKIATVEPLTLTGV